ncbi:MAG TPA: xanthine dehydrogenase FAD-binding subunit XdhB [Clostridia bacterium]|nr:xanthine dehydrogenase FAD-binding subunit XdhB [Clostridia bacterium]
MFDTGRIFEAHSVEEAIELLTANPEAKLICGGTDVLIKIREGELAGRDLVSIHGLPEITGVTMDEEGTIAIGAATTFSKVIQDPIVKAHLPFLAQALETVGGPQIRNMGTIGGNVCNGATSADSASTLFALNAQLKIRNRQGIRVVPIREFYLGPGKVALEHDDVMTHILITRENYEGFGGCYIKYAMRKAMDIATLGCAVLCKVKDKKIVEDVRLAFGVAAPTPIRVPAAEEVAKGKPFSEELVEQFGKAALQGVNPRSSWRASREFRLQLVEELSKRAFRQAFSNAGGEY